jgi:tetratricopeptide (TPR) repeat protein
MAALPYAGFHACTFANNHCMGWGPEAMLECIERLRHMNIAVCGTGANQEEATAPVVIERRGLRFAFLGYNCIGPKGYMAERDKPGCAMVRIHTHYEPYEYTPGAPAMAVTRAYLTDFHALAENIQRVKQSADFVVIYFHWGLHFSGTLILDYQYEVGHAAIDAGADAVLGCGPHMLKGVEIYTGAPIFYSLGNFCTTRVTARDQQGEYAQAMEVLQSSEETAVILALRAECFWGQGQRFEAQELADRALCGQPPVAALLRLRAKIHLAADEPAAAASRLERALQIDRHDYASRYLLAQAYENLGRRDEATEHRRLGQQTQDDLKEMTRLNKEAMDKPNDASVRRCLAEKCRKLDKPELAAMWLQAAADCSASQAPNGALTP